MIGGDGRFNCFPRQFRPIYGTQPAISVRYRTNPLLQRGPDAAYSAAGLTIARLLILTAILRFGFTRFLTIRLVSKAPSHAPQSRPICDLFGQLRRSDFHHRLLFDERLHDELVGAGHV